MNQFSADLSLHTGSDMPKGAPPATKCNMPSTNMGLCEYLAMTDAQQIRTRERQRYRQRLTKLTRDGRTPMHVTNASDNPHAASRRVFGVIQWTLERDIAIRKRPPLLNLLWPHPRAPTIGRRPLLHAHLRDI